MASIFSADWHELLSQSIRSPRELDRFLPPNGEDLDSVAALYPMRLNPYYAGLIQTFNDPIWRQAVPDPAEFKEQSGEADPLGEEGQSVVPNLIHRYPNRVVFIVSDQCAVYCRHCMRKRRVGRDSGVTSASITQGIEYIASNSKVEDVILSGGDPLLLPDQRLFDILTRLRNISHVKIIRIHSRVPCTLPQRITPDLAHGLSRFHPLWFNTQFNHPREITPVAQIACSLLADAGIAIGCQTVLLKKVNDSAEVLSELLQRLLQIRVRPYYLHHPDRVKGTSHFWVSLQEGLEIVARLRGSLSGLALPHYVVDLPGGGGKVPLLPEMVVAKSDKVWKIKNYEGKIFDYFV